jgi:hypothetical protein
MVSTQRIGLAVGLMLGACKPSIDVEDSSLEVSFDGDLLMATEIVGGALLFADYQSGEFLGSRCLSDLVPEECNGEPGFSCMLFEVEFDATDGPGVRLNYTHRNPEVNGQPSSLIGTGLGPGSPLDFRINRISFESFLPDAYDGLCSEEGVDDVRCLLNMAHASSVSPDGALMVFADTRSGRIVLGQPDYDSGVLDVRAVLDDDHPDWNDMAWVNHVELFEENDHLYMLNSFKGGGPVAETQRNAGQIVLWDLSDLQSIQKVWAYPSEGYLAAPHKATRLEIQGQDVLLYAHSLGNADSFDGPQNGSVGLATFSTSAPPSYLGDWILNPDDGHIGFLRDAELLSDGETLLMTDSGCESLNADCHDPGGVFTVDFPVLPEPSGLVGNFSSNHTEQKFHDLTLLRWDILPKLQFPYEADVVSREQLSPFLTADHFGPCSP